MPKIVLRLESIRPDPFAYKPYNPTLQPLEEFPICVAVDIPKEMILRVRDDGVILSPEGLAELMGRIALAMRQRLTEE